jgi:hypothetical protein
MVKYDSKKECIYLYEIKNYVFFTGVGTQNNQVGVLRLMLL